MNITKVVAVLVSMALMQLSAMSVAGGWDNKKGLDQTTIDVELVCLGCHLKRLSGANAQCGLYTQHDVGVKLPDGSLWAIVNNAKGHDVIRGHQLLVGKKATLTGWLYPNAHHVEVDTIEIQGVTAKQLAMAAWHEDQKVAKALQSRQPGEGPPLHNAGHQH